MRYVSCDEVYHSTNFLNDPRTYLHMAIYNALRELKYMQFLMESVKLFKIAPVQQESPASLADTNTLFNRECCSGTCIHVLS